MQTNKIEATISKRFKNGPSNFRLLLLPHLISKIFEKIVHDQMIEYPAQYDILHKYQSGFKIKHLNDLSLSYLNDKILKSFDNDLSTVRIWIDLQKMFDTSDHNILLENLKAIGSGDDTLSIGFIHIWMIGRS